MFAKSASGTKRTDTLADIRFERNAGALARSEACHGVSHKYYQDIALSQALLFKD